MIIIVISTALLHRLSELFTLDILHVDLRHLVNGPQVLPDLADHLSTLRADVSLLKVNSLVVKLQVTLFIERFVTFFTGKSVVIFVNLSDVDIYILEPTRANRAFLLQLQMSRVVVDLLDLTVPQHPPTAGHPAGHRLLLLPPAVLVGQMSLYVSELPGTDVANFLKTEMFVNHLTLLPLIFFTFFVLRWTTLTWYCSPDSV